MGTRRRAADGAIITRFVANQYDVKLHSTVVNTSETPAATQVAELHVENSTVVDAFIHVMAHRSTTADQYASLTVRVLARVDNSGAITVIEASATSPDVMPGASPGAWIVYGAVVSITTAANKLRVNVTPGNTDAVRWGCKLEAGVLVG